MQQKKTKTTTKTKCLLNVYNYNGCSIITPPRPIYRQKHKTYKYKGCPIIYPLAPYIVNKIYNYKGCSIINPLAQYIVQEIK